MFETLHDATETMRLFDDDSAGRPLRRPLSVVLLAGALLLGGAECPGPDGTDADSGAGASDTTTTEGDTGEDGREGVSDASDAVDVEADDSGDGDTATETEDGVSTDLEDDASTDVREDSDAAETTDTSDPEDVVDATDGSEGADTSDESDARDGGSRCGSITSARMCRQANGCRIWRATCDGDLVEESCIPASLNPAPPNCRSTAPEECSSYGTRQECHLRGETCQWLVKGCGGGNAVTTGCYPDKSCKQDSDCPSNHDCKKVTYHPCATFGLRKGSCAACGAGKKVCVSTGP